MRPRTRPDRTLVQGIGVGQGGRAGGDGQPLGFQLGEFDASWGWSVVGEGEEGDVELAVADGVEHLRRGQFAQADVDVGCAWVKAARIGGRSMCPASASR
jgi:hypothetical protein